MGLLKPSPQSIDKRGQATCTHTSTSGNMSSFCGVTSDSSTCSGMQCRLQSETDIRWSQQVTIPVNQSTVQSSSSQLCTSATKGQQMALPIAGTMPMCPIECICYHQRRKEGRRRKERRRGQGHHADWPGKRPADIIRHLMNIRGSRSIHAP